MSFPIVEYATDPESVWEDGKEIGWKWVVKTSMDLRWVASARPYTSDSTYVTLAGSNCQIPIHVSYEDFMRDWVRAKGL